MTRPMKKTLILIFLLSNQLYFGQCDDPIVKILRGVWVKDTQPADTIKFAMTLALDQSFELILADVPRPQGGPAGLYEFRALNGAMLIHWIPAGSFIPQTIPFFIDKDKQHITLGNFYSPKTAGQTFKFHKIK